MLDGGSKDLVDKFSGEISIEGRHRLGIYRCLSSRLTFPFYTHGRSDSLSALQG